MMADESDRRMLGCVEDSPMIMSEMGGDNPFLEPDREIKKGGSKMDLSKTIRGATYAASGTVSRKEFYWNLFWEHKHSTITLCCVFWSFGMCVAFLGPTLLDLGCKTATDFHTMSWVFFSQSFFVLLGSAVGGIMLKWMSADVILLIGTTMMAMTMGTIPLCNALWGLAMVLAVMGFFMGTIDTVANVTMICIYEKEVSPFLQAIHFFYGVGAFVSPMIAQPFLLNEDCSPFISNTSDIPPDLAEFYNYSDMPASTLEEARSMTRIDYAFWIMALLMAPIVLLALSLVGRRFVMGKFDTAASDKSNKQQSEYETMGGISGTVEDDNKSIKSAKNIHNIVIVTLLTAVLMFLYDGLQAAYGGYIYSYAVMGPAKLRKTDAAYLNALFWGMFATGRLLSIALATKLSPALMLFCNIIGCTSGLFLMLSMRYSSIVLIIGTCMMGAFMSSVFPTALSLTEQYIHVTPTITSILVFGAAIGEMTMPVCVGYEFFRKGPTSFLVVGMVLCFLSLITYMTLWLAGLTLIKPDSSSDLVVWFSKYIPGEAEGENVALANQNIQYYSRMRTNSTNETSFDEGGASVSFLRKDSNNQ